MPDHHPTARLRFKFALIGAIGSAMILLPLGQVLRYQGSEIELLVAERATLDPLSQAVAVQRGLLDHRDVAELVLRGRAQLEAERHLRQAEVSASLWALQGTLSAGLWGKALREAETMSQDWRGLALRISQLRISLHDNRVGHQLLAEQAVQVMDLVGATAPAGSFARLVALQVAPAAAGAEAGPAAAAAPRRRLARVEAALQAHELQNQSRLAQLRAAQAALWCVLAAWVAATLWAALQAWRRPEAATPEPEPDAGRRADDAAPPQAETGRLLQRLRERDGDTVSEPPPTLPPRA